jgi:HlyD family secretion protein
MTNHMLETRLGQQSPSHEPYSSGEAPYDRHGLANGRGTGAARTADEPPNAPRGDPPRRSRRRIVARLFVLLLITAAIGGGAWYYFEYRQEDDRGLVLQGNVDVRQVNLAFKVDGRIETLTVDEGDPVKPGQVLATLDKRYFDDELRLARARRDNQKAILERLEHGSRPEEIAEAKAAVAERKASLEKVRSAFQRREELVTGGAVSREDYDNARTAVLEAEARLRTAQESLRLVEIGPRHEDIEAAVAQLRAEEASVSQAERRLADSDLLAPGGGVILTRARERGAIVSPGETVFTLTLSSPVWVRTYVNEPDLGRVQPNMAAYVRTDSASGKTYQGHVGFISPTAEFTPKSVETRELRTDLVYRLRIVVDNPDGALRQGMPVTVRFDDDDDDGGGARGN